MPSLYVTGGYNEEYSAKTIDTAKITIHCFLLYNYNV